TRNRFPGQHSLPFPPSRCGDVVTIDASRAETAQVAPHYGLGRCGLWD
ncbi:unnamed protein product, partial [Ectocarpus sp. 6 AP-2014]